MFDELFSDMDFGGGAGGYDIWSDGGGTFSGSGSFDSGIGGGGGFGGFFGGNEDSAGITQIMGMAQPSYGSFSGGNVFDLGGTWGASDFSDNIGANPYGYTTSGGGGITDLMARGGGNSWMDQIGRLLTPQNLGTAARLVGNGLSIGQGLDAMSQARDLMRQAQEADPMHPYRAGWAARLNTLINDPSSITQDPGYRAAHEAVLRGGAAAGNFGGGGMVGDLAQFGVNFYDNAVRRLGSLVGGSPGAAMPGTQAAIHLGNAGMNRIGSGIASLATGLEGD